MLLHRRYWHQMDENSFFVYCLSKNRRKNSVNLFNHGQIVTVVKFMT